MMMMMMMMICMKGCSSVCIIDLILVLSLQLHRYPACIAKV